MLKLKIVSPERIEFHAPIISSLEKGKVVYDLPSGEKKELSIIGGFVEVQKNVVSVCVELK